MREIRPEVMKFYKWIDKQKFSMDELLHWLGDDFTSQAKIESHPGVIGCLESAGECLRHGAFEWYASTK